MIQLFPLFLDILRRWSEFQLHTTKRGCSLTGWKEENKPNILKTAREQSKATKKILKEVRETIDKKNDENKKSR